MVLGKLPVPGRPTIWITVGQGPAALAVGAGGGCLDIFTLIYPFFPLSPSLWETARYRLKYCLRGPLNPKPTNQPTSYNLDDSRARVYCACSRCGWRLFGHFYSFLSFLSSFPLSLGEARYRLKYCLKGPLNPKQPTKQLFMTDNVQDRSRPLAPA